MASYRNSHAIALVFVLELALAPQPVSAQSIPQRLSALETAVTVLQAQVTALERQLNASNGVIAALQAALGAEQTARGDADAGLQAQITTLQTTVDAQKSTAHWGLVFDIIPLSTQFTTVATLDLPAGSYVVTGRVGLSGFTEAGPHAPTGSCQLVAAGTLDTADVTVTTPSIALVPTIVGLTHPFTLQGAVVSPTATTVTLRCIKHADLDTVSAVFPTLMAVTVGQVIVSFP